MNTIATLLAAIAATITAATLVTAIPGPPSAVAWAAVVVGVAAGGGVYIAVRRVAINRARPRR